MADLLIVRLLLVILKIPLDIALNLQKPLRKWIPGFKKLPLILQKSIAILLTISVLIGSYSNLLLFIHPSSAEAAWYDDSYAYRERVDVTVASSASDITNLETLLTVNTSTPITAGKLQSSCQDLRFTSATGKLLKYYIDSGCNTSSTKIWVMLDLVPKNTTTYTMYMYYGNPSASTGSNSGQFDNVVGLKGYWTMNDNTGTTATDSSVTGDNGTLTNGPTWGTGNYGSDVSLTSASSQYVTAPYNAALDPSSAITVEAWVKTTDVTQNFVMFVSKASAGGNGWNLRLNGTGGKPMFTIQTSAGYIDQGSYTTSIAMTNNTWAHVVGTYDGSTVKTYVNGALSGSFAASGTIVTLNTALTVGRRTDGFYFNGEVDDVKVYNTARSAAEIANDYTNTSCGGNTCTIATTAPATIVPTTSFASEEKANGPVLYWKFDDGTGTTAKDSTTNALNGTLAGSVTPTWTSEDQCISGKCLYFNSNPNTNNPIVKKTVTSTTPTSISGDLTVSAWIKPTSNYVDLFGNIVRNGQGADTYYLLGYDYANQRPYFQWYDGSFRTINFNANSAPINNWSFVTVVRSGTSLSFYVNGVAAGTGTATTPTVAPSELSVGQTDNAGVNQDYTGYIDEVKIYNYAKSSTQVTADFNAVADREGVAQKLGINRDNSQGSLANGLVGYWKMDESSWNGTSGEVKDSSGDGNSGTAAGATDLASVTAGKFGNAGNFDGTDDYVQVTNFPVNFSNISIGFWFNSSDVTSTRRILEDNWNSGGAFTFHTSGGSLFGIYRDSSGNQYSTVNFGSVSINTWYHLVMTFDGSSEKGYLNGSLVNTQSATNGLKQITTNLYLGATSGLFFQGKLDETRIYNRALSPAEVSTLYNFAPGPTNYWNFEEGSGTTVNDRSGNGNTGTFNGTTTNIWTSGKYGKAGKFNGTDNYVSATLSTSAQTNDYTMEAWIYANATGGTKLITMGDSNVADQVLGFSSGILNGISYRTGGADSGSASTTVTTGTWHHVAMVRNSVASTVYIYLDGKVDGSFAIGNATANFGTTKIFSVGSRGGTGNYFNGNIDDARFYNYARTSGQIVEDMNGGHPLGGSPVGSPLGWWKFNEGYGTTANNSGSQGSTYNGTLNNMASPATSTSGWNLSGKFGKALAFDGTNDYVSIPNTSNALMPTSNQPFTMSVWINPTSLTTTTVKTIAVNETYTVSGFRWGIDSNGKMDFWTSESGGSFFVNGVKVLTTGNWYHVAVTYDGTTAKTYINGVQDSSATGTYIGNTNNINFGLSIGGKEYWNGLQDEIKIYNAALTADQIKLDMNQGSTEVLGAISDNSSYALQAANQEYCVPGDSTSCAAPVVRWDFEEGSGTTAQDSSGNAISGTLTNGPTYVPGKYGKAVNLNGTNQFVLGSNPSSLQITTGTMEAWIKTSNAGSSYRGIVTKQNAYGIFLKDNVFELYDWSASADRTTSVNLADGTWHHVTATFQSGVTNGTSLYIDGVLKLTTTMTVTSQLNGLVAGSGTDGAGSQYFGGNIDGVKVFNYVRSPAQVALDYNRGAPLAWYKLDECQGDKANDSSGNGYTGTLSINSDTTYTSFGTCNTSSSSTMWGAGATGKRNASLGFGGVGNNVDTTATSSTFDATNGYISASFWFKQNAAAQGVAVSKGGAGSGGWAIFVNNDGTIQAWFKQNSSQTIIRNSSITHSTGTWNHVVVLMRLDTATLANNDIQIYVNGVLDQGSLTATAAPTSCSTSCDLKIGARSTLNTPGGPFFNGELDDVRIYPYALTQTQVRQVMNNGAINYSPVTGTP